MNNAQAFSTTIDQQLTRWLGAIPVLLPILQRLNVVSIINKYVKTEADVDCGTVALILALNRLLAPKPLYKVADWLATTVLQETLDIGAEKFHDRRIGDMLDDIHPHIGSIWQEIAMGAITEFGISIDFIHYDITSIYFEGEYIDAQLIDYGYSRDKRPDCKQVNLQLNVTGNDAIPVAYKVIGGRTADKTTPLQNMRALAQLFGKPNSSNPPSTASQNLIIVSDSAMLCAEVIVTYHSLGIGYLGPLPTEKAYDSVLMSVQTKELLNYPLNYRPVNHDDNEPAIYYGLPKQVVIADCKTNQSVTANALLLLSLKKAQLDREKRATLLNRYLSRLEQIQTHLNSRKYKKLSYTTEQIKKAQQQYQGVKSLVDVSLSGCDGQLKLSIAINETQLACAAERDGRYLLVTNKTLSPDEMLTRQKQQDIIEKRISTIKGPIRLRPIFLQNQNRIESLVFIAMIALLAFSLLELMAKRVGQKMTARYIIEQFTTLWAVYTDFADGSQICQVVPLTDFQHRFLQTHRLPEPSWYLSSFRLQSDFN